MVVSTQTCELSVPVRLELQVDDKRFPLAQIDSDEIVLATSSVLPGGTGIVVAKIGADERRWGARWEESDSVRKLVAIELIEFDAAK